MKTLIPDDEIKRLINIIGGENNIKGIKLKLWSLYISFNDSQKVDIEGVKALPFVLNIIVGDSQIEISCKDNEQDNYLFDYFINNHQINTLQGATERILKKILIIIAIALLLLFVFQAFLESLVSRINN
ncbi:hypothetical protein [Aggregatibacter aphrophilus]|jgi:hypothetical protein|uniref:PTS EIIB type-1 domain-containing protein n=2 Tax=Aggregatibacter aphrophilus TaxID=732 RepID=A0A336N6N1_AGGAP|nr:hypothetical protein [Aggregatibacter aphrophilus]KNE84542.1 hypothetical protein ATCC33389_0210700 [Aggregatibacter aphrophilus ATCC 33389]OBY50522.1 hypothetical protein BBB51_09010 [Aggregatibacter aphrophilus]RDE88543.1 hypothetical protein DPW00_04115 [Aggregatibacter aphrophilus]SSZ30097.1 Uncharacterised protein [Aggregatibacter aphrophilus]VEF42498.1 Uncharacterised protein [Aggregatibacter aphrophilus ATCC 33389]